MDADGPGPSSWDVALEGVPTFDDEIDPAAEGEDEELIPEPIEDEDEEDLVEDFDDDDYDGGFGAPEVVEDEEVDEAEVAAVSDRPQAAEPAAPPAALEDFARGTGWESQEDHNARMKALMLEQRAAKKQRRKRPASLISLTEYNMLMDAKAKRAAAIAAEAARNAPPTVVVIPEDAALDINRSSFMAFKMDGVELLVSETADGRLALADSYVYAPGDAYYMRPAMQGAVPRQALHFSTMPWLEVNDGDELKNKPPSSKLKKMYFLGVDGSPSGGVLDLGSVFMFDAGTRALKHEQVKVIGKRITDPVLRIRPQGITLEDAGNVPTPIEVSMGTATDMVPEDDEALSEKLEEMLQEKEDLMDDFDEAPDVPSVDMM